VRRGGHGRQQCYDKLSMERGFFNGGALSDLLKVVNRHIWSQQRVIAVERFPQHNQAFSSILWSFVSSHVLIITVGLGSKRTWPRSWRRAAISARPS
jgi:hypothetical protein